MRQTKRPRRRLLGPLLLAVVLASESAGLALAARLDQPEPGRAAVASTAVGWSSVGRGRALARATAAELRIRDADAADRSTPPALAADRLLGAEATSRVRPSVNRGATKRPDLAPAPRAAASSRAANEYRGRNRVWIPELRIDRSVAAFPCSRSRPPDNLVYRWGCAGRNNVYLLGHAYSVFAPLHDAYVRGRLHKGLEVVYANGDGAVRTYAVVWWRVTAPTSAASWAWAAQKRPSMTLQTCIGEDSANRLIVRLVERP
jgi:hypothetical protein